MTVQRDRPGANYRTIAQCEECHDWQIDVGLELLEEPGIGDDIDDVVGAHLTEHLLAEMEGVLGG